MISPNQIGKSEPEAGWQKHVIVALWFLVALLILVGVILAYGAAHGLFRSSSDVSTPVPAWPEGS
jgi:hypothetical protein